MASIGVADGPSRGLRVQSAAADVHQAGECNGQLQHMPTSWLHQLTVSLHPDDRLSLFSVCRQLAHQMVHSTPKLYLDLWEERQPNKLSTSRSSILQLLGEGRDCSVRVCGQCQAVFPIGLGAYVTTLTVSWHGLGEQFMGSTGWDWNTLPNLQKLTLEYKTDHVELHPLSAALRAGTLPKLSCLKLKLLADRGGSTATAGPHSSVLERLARAAGLQVTKLTTHDNNMLQHLHHFKVLQYLQMYCCSITTTTLSQPEQLFLHPTLQHVKLWDCSMAFPYCKCSWESCTVGPFWDLSIIHELPTERLSEVRLLFPEEGMKGRVPNWMKTLVFHWISKNIVLVPPKDGGDVTLVSPCHYLLGLLQHIRQPCRVDIQHALPASVPVLWRSLPPCVHEVILTDCEYENWELLWQGLPSTVTHLHLDSDVDDDVLVRLVDTSPAHLVQLQVYGEPHLHRTG